jgi:hypothetical protein
MDVGDKFTKGSKQAFAQLFHSDRYFLAEDYLLVVACGIAGPRQLTEC